MANELTPTSHMIPYLLMQSGRNFTTKEPKELIVEKSGGVPQNTKNTDSGVTEALLMQAHAVSGIEVCKCLPADVLGPEAQRLAVMLYEEDAGPIWVPGLISAFYSNLIV